MPKVTLSFKDHLGVGLGCALTLYRTAFSLIAFPFQRSKGPALLKHHLSFIFFRAFLGSFSPRGLASIVPSTDEVYQNTLEAEGLKPESISLPDGTRVHLMGDSSAEKVLLFFHGGGYIMPAVAGHFQLLASTLRQIKREGSKLSVLFLEHDLAVVSPYPRQLQQAAALLDYTLTTLGKRPEQIILAGDSAGGNLALALLSHILHPHPKVPPVKFEGKLASLALLSPWVTFDTKSKSMVKNQYKDTLAVHSLEKWSSTFRGEAALDAYLEPLEAPKDWFEGIPVEKSLVMAGSDEVFADDIQKFGERLKPVLPLTTLEVVKDEAHDHLILGFLLNGPERKRLIFQDWISESVNSGVL